MPRVPRVPGRSIKLNPLPDMGSCGQRYRASLIPVTARPPFRPGPIDVEDAIAIFDVGAHEPFLAEQDLRIILRPAA